MSSEREVVDQLMMLSDGGKLGLKFDIHKLAQWHLAQLQAAKAEARLDELEEIALARKEDLYYSTLTDEWLTFEQYISQRTKQLTTPKEEKETT